MSTEDNLDIIARYFNRETRTEVVDQQRMRIVDTPGVEDTNDLDRILEYDRQDNVAEHFADVDWRVEDVISDGDKVVVRWRFAGTTMAPFQHLTTGITIPAGRTISRRGITMLVISDGKVVEERTYEDRLGVLEQLGWRPSTWQPVGEA